MNRNNNRDGISGKSDGEKSSNTSRTTKNNDEVQTAIESLKDMRDDELQEVLDDDFMDGLNVVDTWDGDDEAGDEPDNRDNRDRVGRRGTSRERYRRDHRGVQNRSNSNRERERGGNRERGGTKRGAEERKRNEEMRRDPSKSSQDIERDKIRTKRINESKILAEQQKAIKNLLDSDKVVPPGTEVEAIEHERQMDRVQQRMHRSRERRRSWDRHRVSPVRRRSTDRIRISSPLHQRFRSPLISPEHRRTPERFRKSSWERRLSIERRERRSSAERRRRLEERELRMMSRRSRSRERHRSRSMERNYRSRWSRSPISRRDRSGIGSRHRTISKSPDRRRKRSPFINEIARQFRDESLMQQDHTGLNSGYMHQSSMRGIPAPSQQPAPPSMMNSQLHPSMALPPAQHYLHPDALGPPPMGPPSTYMPYDSAPPPPTGPPQGPPLNFEAMSMSAMSQTEYSAAPVLYNQPNSVPMMQQHGDFPPVHMRSPQPVPAPNLDQSMMYNVPGVGSMHASSPSPQPDVGHHIYSDRDIPAYNGGSSVDHRERLKTPEPPVISNTKPFEKTSLSSLLEASVSAKDTSVPVLYPGFKPEILRNCEMALRDLPDEDPRLKIKGRFFFDPTKEEPINDTSESSSNSILLQKNKNKIFWDGINNKDKQIEESKPNIEMHQKYCQTDVKIEVDMSTETTYDLVERVDFCVQVCPGELAPPPREERPRGGVMDRLDGNVNDSSSFDYGSKRQVTDLRFSLSNSSQKRSLNRGVSPTPIPSRDDRNHSHERMSHQEHDSRDYHRLSIRRSDNFSIHRGRRSFSPHDQYSSDFRRDLDHQNDYRDDRDDRSREGSPMMLEETDDIQIIEQDSFSRDSASNWRGSGRGKSFSSFSSSHKSRPSRAKHSTSRSFRGGRGGSYRGKI